MLLFLTADRPDQTNSPTSLYNIWNAASVILGFQFSAFMWRMTRERDMEKANRATWLPVADKLNILSMLISIGGVFIAPIFGLTHAPPGAFAFSLILGASYPVALAGHYGLFGNGWSKNYDKEYFPRQEQIVLWLVTFLLCGAIIWWAHWQVGITGRITTLAVFGILLFMGLVIRSLKGRGEPVSNSEPLPDASEKDNAVRLLTMEEATLQAYRNLFLIFEAAALSVAAILFELKSHKLIYGVCVVGVGLGVVFFHRCREKLKHVRFWERRVVKIEASELGQYSMFRKEFPEKPGTMTEWLAGTFLLLWIVVFVAALFFLKS